MQILLNEPLKEYTNYKIGGKTPKLYIVNTMIDLNELSDKDLRDSYILGAGTNILVSDEGVEESVIKIDFQQFFLDETKQELTIGSGVSLSQAAKTLADKGYKGLDNVSGIPGSIGGAVVMNAGASFGDISDSLIDVEAYNKQTRERRIFTKTECRFGFRTSIFQNSPWIITFVHFGLKKGDKQELFELYNKIDIYRQKNYPTTFPSAGCWFKRDWGGRTIINKLGMSGAIEGRAIVSPLFPAFILNTGGATAKDVYSLVEQIQNRARAINKEMPCEIITWGKI